MFWVQVLTSKGDDWYSGYKKMTFRGDNMTIGSHTDL